MRNDDLIVQTNALERRAFYFFRAPLADDYKRMIMLRILHYVRSNSGAKIDLLYRELKTICPEKAIIEDAVQALASKDALHGLTILRFNQQRSKSQDCANFSIKHRKSDQIAEWERFLAESHPELVAMVVQEH